MCDYLQVVHVVRAALISNCTHVLNLVLAHRIRCIFVLGYRFLLLLTVIGPVRVQLLQSAVVRLTMRKHENFNIT